MSNKGDGNPVDAVIAAAARALAAGDALGALNRVALRDDGPALALRGIAMAQVGEFERARTLLRGAARKFGSDTVARARCLVAEAEVALVAHDLGGSRETLVRARESLERHGDRVNAAHARHLEARRALLLGDLPVAGQAIAAIDARALPAALQGGIELVVAGVALRRVQVSAARAALTRALDAARRSRIPSLVAEAERATRMITAPAARLLSHGAMRMIALADVERALSSGALIVDGFRNAVRRDGRAVALATRPVLFALAHTLAESWPEEVTRDVLLARAFGARFVDDSHRARLRVEIGRLRGAIRDIAGIGATKRGFVLDAKRAPDVVVLARPIDEEHASLLALLEDGEPWSSSALALALGQSQRTVQRGLEELARRGKVEAIGAGRARRWITSPLPGITTALLLPAALPIE